MPFHKSLYANLVAEKTESHTRLIRDYDGLNKDFDTIVVGSGMGGGVLGDDLADRLGHSHRILVLDVGSFIYPTHVYNISRIPNGAVTAHFGVDNFKQFATDHHFIGGKPQLGFGGRSIFWSGLIPRVQSWELDFFPETVRSDLSSQYFDLAVERMNTSISLGSKAKEVVAHFRNSGLGDDFDIQETPRALHQPYLNPSGAPRDRFFTEPTGVFNTAELLINQVGLTPGRDQGGGTLRMPWKQNRDAGFNNESVVDENLEVRGSSGLYVCDMSVMPISTAANPVLTLAGLALRLSRHLGTL